MAASSPEREASWLVRALAGDAEAFGELVRSHQAAVRLQLRRLTRGETALADDLAQETFVLAWTRLAQFRREARFSTWLYRIAYHQFLMHARGRRATPAFEHEPLVLRTADPQPNHFRIDLDRALARLPEAEHAAIVHCFLLDLSHGEAAEVLGLPLGTLKSHVNRAKSRLRESLSAWQPETHHVES
jgi:RNA polymerase sigma-70 factor (ECF subfamily)